MNNTGAAVHAIVVFEGGDMRHRRTSEAARGSDRTQEVTDPAFNCSTFFKLWGCLAICNSPWCGADTPLAPCPSKEGYCRRAPPFFGTA